VSANYRIQDEVVDISEILGFHFSSFVKEVADGQKVSTSVLVENYLIYLKFNGNFAYFVLKNMQV
jgi:hypothetical protein